MTAQIAIGQSAPDFELTDVEGKTVRLSGYGGKKHVLLIFTRSFM